MTAVRFVAFADHHGDPECIEGVLRLAARERPSFIVCAGDFTQFGQGMEPAWSRLVESRLPVFFVAGNHEDREPVARAEERSNLFRHVGSRLVVLGLPDLRVRIQIAGLDGADEFNPHEGEDLKAADTHLRRIRKDWTPDLPLVLVTHFPPIGTACCGPVQRRAGDIWIIPDLENTGLGCVAARKVTEALQPAVVVTGHFHDRGPAARIRSAPPSWSIPARTAESWRSM